MANTAESDYVGQAGHRDVEEMAALSVAELPTMTALHDVEGWRTHNRFGRGANVRGNCTAVLRDGGAAGTLIGFIWADSAMMIDCDLDVPWWCINAVAVSPAYRGAGRGARLVSLVQQAADEAGVELLYGQSVPGAVKFWKTLGWNVADPGEDLRMPRAVRRTNGELVTMRLQPGPDDRFFLQHTAHSNQPPGLVRDSQFIQQ
jgi:GNAT superfamily N-acetyltransferase